MAASTRPGSRTITLTIAAIAMLPVIGILSHPEQVFRASIGGLELWWKIVFPALLPYMVFTEVMQGYGLFDSLGRRFEPWMRQLYRLPGAAGACLWLGAAAGQTASAAVVADLRRRSRLTREEGERLLTLSHLSSPAVIITVVGIGCFGSWRTGVWLAAIHLATAALAGIVMAGLRRSATETYPPAQADVNATATASANNAGPSTDARRPASSSLGRLLGEAVTTSVQRLFLLGAYMMLAAVSLELLRQTGLPGIAAATAGHDLIQSSLAAFGDSLLGSLAASRMDAPQFAAAIASFSLAWGGFSSHAQAYSLTAGTGLRYTPFAVGRLLHAAAAAAAAWLLWPISGQATLGRAAVDTLAAMPAASSDAHAVTAASPAFWAVSLGFAVAAAAAALLIARLAAARSRPHA